MTVTTTRRPGRAPSPAARLRRGAPLLAAAALALAAGAPAAAARPSPHVAWAMRQPVVAGRARHLLFTVRAPGAARPPVSVLAFMPAMPMRTRPLAARAVGRGRYRVTTPLTMPGAWTVAVTVGRGAAATTTALPLRVIANRPLPWRLAAVGVAAVLALALLAAAYARRRRPPSPASGSGA
jgi:hypothetical protein